MSPSAFDKPAWQQYLEMMRQYPPVTGNVKPLDFETVSAAALKEVIETLQQRGLLK